MSPRNAPPRVRPAPTASLRRRLKPHRLEFDLLEDRTLLSVLVVNNGTDVVASDQLSLRQAIAQANTDAAAGTSDTITFDPSLGGRTILLAQGELELSGAGTGTITIDGSSSSSPITLEASYITAGRAFQVDSGVHAVITNINVEDGDETSDNGGAILNAGMLTLSNATVSESFAVSGGAIENTGKLTLNNTTLSGNGASSSGGAIDNSDTLVVNDSTFTSNSGDAGGGIANSGTLSLVNTDFSDNSAFNSGGAINNANSGTLTVTGGLYTGNTASGSGGAIENSSATATLSEVTFSGNSASTLGGAIDDSAGPLTLTDSTVSGNISQNGGAISNSAGSTVTVTASALSSNTAYGVGGAIDNSGTLTVSDASIFFNVAYGSGGGIENDGGTLNVSSSTLSGNTAYESGGGINNNGGTLALLNSIVDGDTASSTGPDISGSITTDSGYNLLGTAANNATNDPTPGPGDVFNDNLGLSAGNFGGPTETMALLTGSPAIGAGNASAMNPATDQRGLSRVVNGSLDIGAFQTQPPTLVFTTLEQTADAGQPTTISLQLDDLDGNPVAAGSAGATVTLASSSTGAVFLNANGSALVGSTITIPAGSTGVSFEYDDTRPGTPTLTVSATGFASATQQQTILPAPIAVTPQPSIVVGRVLSYYDVPDVQQNGNQLTITYTVYNESADSETGVLLTTTLEQGVTFLGSSVTVDGTTTTQLPDQDGQNLAWSLGTIQGDDYISVAVTVSVSNEALGTGLTTPTQLDTGALAFATLDAGAVSASTPAATLSPNAIDPELLASTVDADTNDPYIQEEAAALDYNAQNIFNFLRTQIGYNAYEGSLRGARGTLWSSAGNALDVASLGVALLRASGIQAQYVEGTLSETQAQTLILSMFLSSYQTVGYIPSGTTASNPEDDSQLIDETESHYWFEFDTGSGWVNADPLMAGAMIGQTFTTSTGTFTAVPQSLEATTEVQLVAEIYNTADAAFGLNALQDTTVLDQTFDDAELVGRPLTIGNFVAQSGIGAIFTEVTNTYTPYIVVGDDALADSQLPDAIVGQPYQEVLTNFPLASQILTGLFLNVTLAGPGTTTQTFSQTVVDRIGYAARQGMGAPEDLSVSPSDPPIISPFDLTTLNILPGLQSPGAAQLEQERANQELASVSTDTDPTTVDQTDALMAVARSELANFAVFSDDETADLEHGFSVEAYFDAPRVTTFSSQLVTANNTSTISYSIDLVNDSVRAIASPGQSVQATLGFAGTRGIFDSILESQILPVPPGGQNLSAAAIIQQSVQQGIPLVVISAGNLSLLQALNLPADAASRITTNVQNGLAVIVPTQPLTVNGTQTTAWYDFNPTTGEIIAESQNGGYQGLTEFGSILATVSFASLAFASLIFVGSYAINPHLGQFVKGATAGAGGVLGNYLVNATETPIGVILFVVDALIVGLATGLLAAGDPPLPPELVDLNLPYPDLPADTSSAQQNMQPNEPAGQIAGTVQSARAVASGNLTASWRSEAASSFLTFSLGATAATVADSQGTAIGSGTAALSTAVPTQVVISGNTQYVVNGQGSLSFYGQAEASLGVSGDWKFYTAAVTGNVSVTLTVPAGALTLNGQALPAGTYTITTSSATLSGSGTTSSPNFAGSVSITTTDGTINLGPGSGSLSVGAKPLDPDDETTLDGYGGTITVSANGDGTDSVNLNGNAGNVLQVAPASSTLTTDQNTPVTFAANIQTSLADTYTLTANAPAGWTVTIDDNGNVTVTPAPGLQGGTYPIQIIAQSSSDPNLIAQTTIDVTVAPTQPGMTLAANPDSVFTVPFDGAQVPTAFRAVIDNTGPAADTYNLSFANVPSGFTLVSSATSDTVPAGETGIVGIYLIPNAGSVLPAPGT
jgi:transglutaminase-like putative cysteine protease